VTFHEYVCAPDTGVQLMLKLSRSRRTTARQRADNDAVGWAEIGEDSACDVAQLACDTMPFHRSPNRFRYDQADVRLRTGGGAVSMYYEVGLRCTHAVTDGVGELCRPCHPVTSREH
jgi:hypothetical protein